MISRRSEQHVACVFHGIHISTVQPVALSGVSSGLPTVPTSPSWRAAALGPLYQRFLLNSRAAWSQRGRGCEPSASRTMGWSGSGPAACVCVSSGDASGLSRRRTAQRMAQERPHGRAIAGHVDKRASLAQRIRDADADAVRCGELYPTGTMRSREHRCCPWPGDFAAMTQCHLCTCSRRWRVDCPAAASAFVSQPGRPARPTCMEGQKRGKVGGGAQPRTFAGEGSEPDPMDSADLWRRAARR